MMEKKGLSTVIWQPNGQYTLEFSDLMRELKPQIEAIAQRMIEWSEEQDCEPGNIHLLKVPLADRFETEFIFEWAMVGADEVNARREE